MKKQLQTFLFALLAGIAIGLGGVCFLSLNNGTLAGKVIGALFFTVGLFTICTRGYNLFTGKICYLFDNKPSYLLSLLLILIGNFCGSSLFGLLLRLTRAGDSLAFAADRLVVQKLGDSTFSLFCLAVVCNIFIYIAVDGFRSNTHETGKYLSLFLGVGGFILCGSEHCVANMFYFAVSGCWFDGRALETLLKLLVMIAGNAVGGLFFPLLERVARPKQKS